MSQFKDHRENGTQVNESGKLNKMIKQNLAIQGFHMAEWHQKRKKKSVKKDNNRKN